MDFIYWLLFIISFFITIFVIIKAFVKKYHGWKVGFVLLLTFNLIFISLAEYLLSNSGPHLAGMLLVLPIAFIDCIVLLSYLMTQRPQGKAKIIGYTILITVTFLLLSVAGEVKGYSDYLKGRLDSWQFNDIDPLLDTFFGKPIHKPCLPPEGTSVSRRLMPHTQDNKERLGHPGKTVPGQVTVELAKPIFRRGECVKVRITNGLNVPVGGRAWWTGCTTILIERRWLIGWREAAGCVPSGWSQPQPVEIGPSEVVEVALDPYNPHLLSYGVKPPAFDVGIYRAVFNTVTSPPFLVLP